MALIPVAWRAVAWWMLLPSVSAAATSIEPLLLERIAVGLTQAPVLRAEFTQTKTIAALTRPLVTSGHMVYVRQQGVLWRIEQPYRVTYALTDSGVSEIGADGARRQTMGQGTGLQNLSRIFRALFEPDFKALEQYFTPAARGEAARWEMTLTPRTTLRQVFNTVHLQGGRFVEQVRFEESNGDTMTIRFRQLREAVALDGEERRALRRE
jgi:hypothetical protein